jgi:hydrogenase 3 maturation protease
MGSGLIPGRDPADALPPLRERRWLLVGVGNDMRGDDAFGPLLARRLKEQGLPAIDAGMAPENTTGPILRAKPEVLILADATDLGAPVGTMRVLPPDALAEGGTSTHDPSLRLLLAFLEAHHPMEVWALVAQAGGRELGAPPAPEIAAAVEHAASLFALV